MSQESGKKKKFSYKLNTVLKAREIHKKKQQEKLSLAKKKLKKEEEKEASLKEFQSKKYQELRDTLDKGKTLDFSTLILRKTHLSKVAKEVEEQEDKRKKAAKTKAKEQDVLLEKMQEEEMIKKDKERRHQLWKQAVKKEDVKKIDDISTNRYNRKKQSLD